LTATGTATPTATETDSPTATPTYTATPSATPTATPTASSTITQTFTITETFTTSPTLTVTPTITQTFTISPTFTVTDTATPVPGFYAAQPPAGVVVAANVPHRGEDLCFAFQQPLASAGMIFYNIAGERIAELAVAGGQPPCLSTGALAPDLYYVKIQASLADGTAVERMLKVIILP
jgi:hypothetical protein